MTKASESHSRGPTNPTGSSTALLMELKKVIGQAPDPKGEPPDYELLASKLRNLHAHFRTHQASDYFSPSTNPAVAAAPQLSDDFTRLSTEHPRIMGMLDLLIRNVESMPDRPVEDRDVFLLRIRELIAVLRRHEAEEERLFLLAMWHDTGGES